MASVGGVSSSNTVSSLMNSANMISGLASGLDTEGMIESLVKSYQTKINQLNQKVTKVEWKQDAYRSIISKMVGFNNKYTSYTSNTNLMSPSFFNNSVKVLTKGEFKDSVTASGKTGSDISLNAVHQLATAAQYRTKSNLTTSDTGTIAGKGVDLFTDDPSKKIELSNLSGSLSLTYGSKTVSISFNENTDVEAMNNIREKLVREQGGDESKVSNTDVLAGLINQKLADEKIVFTNGNAESADQRIKATTNEDGQIVLEELGTGKNGVYISGASGNIAAQFGLSEEDLESAADKKITVIDANNIKDVNGKAGLTRKLNGIEFLAEKSVNPAGRTMNMSLDGSTKQIDLPHVYANNGTYSINGVDVTEKDFANKYTEELQKSVKSAFGDKVTVENKGNNGELALEFKVKNEGSDLVINADVGDALGIGRIATSYLNTSKTLKDLMGDKLSGLDAVKDKDGKEVLDDKGKKQYDFTLNGVKIGTYTEDTKLSTILSDINSNKDAGVQVSYSQTTQNFTFKAKETGADSKIEFGNGLAQAMFGKAENREFSADKTAVSDLLSKNTDYDATINESGDNAMIRAGDFNFTFKINKDDKVSDVVQTLNDMFEQMRKDIPTKEFDFTATLDEKTGALSIKDNNTGKDMALSYEGITKNLFSAVANEARATGTYTAGQDAIFTATINGEQKYMTRTSNSVNIDGLTINMEETFNSKASNGENAYEVDDVKKSVTFQNKTDSDKIIDAIKTMVNDYNTMMSEIKSAYSTMPYQKSNGTFANYEPLTDDDREGMSESAIERYEEKAKQGILFGDRELSNLYTKMNQAFSFSNTEDVDTLKDMGITVSFNVSGGEQAVTIDEEKLRAMLDSDPDRVANLFTKNDGIMDRMKTQLDSYAKTTGEPKGILIQKAGSPLSSLSLMNNTWQKEIDNYNTQIEKWQDKLSSQVEKYTKQFSRLEQLIQQMNSQSSTLAGMMGG